MYTANPRQLTATNTHTCTDARTHLTQSMQLKPIFAIALYASLILAFARPAPEGALEMRADDADDAGVRNSNTTVNGTIVGGQNGGGNIGSNSGNGGQSTVGGTGNRVGNNRGNSGNNGNDGNGVNIGSLYSKITVNLLLPMIFSRCCRDISNCKPSPSPSRPTHVATPHPSNQGSNSHF
ncbi:hypothetical protein BDN71DRAFT_516277 [Pleurotus eryngii]|uniref:Uncharacterized protein n=1 Tax=Pleurotus eryngii TaxID=5323 RepID=A0A9P6DIL1_PLEER|nr:hypothetical protein BDN71DRAFT_516277 [Pleurotus eryngii]